MKIKKKQKKRGKCITNERGLTEQECNEKRGGDFLRKGMYHKNKNKHKSPKHQTKRQKYEMKAVAS